MKLRFAITPLLILFIGFTFQACKSEQAEKMISQIDQLSASIDSSEQVYQSIDTLTVIEIKQNSEEQLEYLSKFFTDTTYQNARFVDVYNSNWKLMRKLLKGYARLGSEIDFSRNQLHHLRNDVSNGFSSDSIYVKYLEGEIKAVQKIEQSTQVMKSWELKSIDRYNGMVQPIDSIITELKNQGFR
jgi:hypothetical protein